MGHGVKSLSNRSGIPTCCSEMVQECSRDKVLDLSLWFLGWLRHTLDDFDVSSMIGHILYVYMIHTFWDIFFGSNLRSIPSNQLFFLNLPHVWSRSISDAMSLPWWFHDGSSRGHCITHVGGSNIANPGHSMYGMFANICQPKLTIHDSCWTLSSTQEDGDGEAFGEWEIGGWTACKHRDFSKGTPQSMGILAPYAGPIPFPLESGFGVVWE